MIKIGYQGIIGSNSEKAAKKIASKLSLEDVEFVSLVTSKRVVGQLKREEIDYGVVAIKNSIGGIVQETYSAIKTEFLDLIATELIPIHHSLFIKNSNIEIASIKEVASHPQALKQCEKNIKKKFGEITLNKVEDTAISAKYMSTGELSENTAILCSKEAGLNYNLHLVSENFEDSSENITEFRMIKKSILDSSKTALKDKLLHLLFTDRGLNTLSKGIMIGVIFGSLYFQNKLGMSDFDTASTVGGLLSGLFLFLTSSKLKNQVRYRSITGYWKYYSVPENFSNNGIDQKYEVPRIVKIEEVDGELYFKGWMCDDENAQLFSSLKVLTSDLDQKDGKLIYWYNTPSVLSRDFALNGIVTLGWDRNNTASKINKMSGWYLGKSTNELGSINYSRISKSNFISMKNSDYL